MPIAYGIDPQTGERVGEVKNSEDIPNMVAWESEIRARGLIPYVAEMQTGLSREQQAQYVLGGSPRAVDIASMYEMGYEYAGQQNGRQVWTPLLRRPSPGTYTAPGGGTYTINQDLSVEVRQNQQVSLGSRSNIVTNPIVRDNPFITDKKNPLGYGGESSRPGFFYEQNPFKTGEYFHKSSITIPGQSAENSIFKPLTDFGEKVSEKITKGFAIVSSYGGEAAEVSLILPFAGRVGEMVYESTAGMIMLPGRTMYNMGKTGGIGKGLDYTLTEVYQSSVESFKREPLETAATFYIIGKIGEKIPKLKYKDIEITTGETEKVEIGGIYKEIPKKIKLANVLGFETEGGRSFVLFSKVDPLAPGSNFKFTIGRTPDLFSEMKYILKSKKGSFMDISGALETNIIENSILNAPKAETTIRSRSFIKPAYDVLKRTLNIESKFNTEKLPTQTKFLNQKQLKIFYDIGRKFEGVLFGSTSRDITLSRYYVKNGKLLLLEKIPKDIELRFDLLNDQDLNKITKIAIEELRKEGMSTAREIRGKPFTIEAEIGGKYEKVAEFKGNTALDQAPEKVLGITKTGEPLEVEKLKITRLNEELRGVTQGISKVRFTEGKIDIFPEEKRIKDIGSFSVSARTLYQSEPNLKLLKSIEKVESLFDKDLVEAQMRSPEKEIIHSFKKPNVEIPYSFSGRYIPNISLSRSISPSKTYSMVSYSSSYSSFSRSISPLKSPYSLSNSISKSKVFSKSGSVSISPSKSFSPSISASPSISTSRSVSKSPSISASPSISTSRSPPIYPIFKKEDKKIKSYSLDSEMKDIKRAFKYTKNIGGIVTKAKPINKKVFLGYELRG